ncbi:AMP-binding protein [Anabaena sp. UHCC 0399]|uniref:AMP-binding protein n=1 Tax=Anabaena sp. UHCC 0399 TaxID=3110238 RepID=UPI002B1EC39C|nr:AMP-binding protein [Anabaena sp. UHCC 0399]MEA5565925.1 AMP-binding protein [Anabaena sp. UHCC 0399]
MSKFSTWIELLSYRAIHQPDKIAYIFLQEGEKETFRLSYQELDTLSRAIASQLQSLELTGERALLLYPPGLEFIAAFLGCLYAGVIAVPAYPPRQNQKMTRLSAIVSDASAKVALTTNSLLKDIQRSFVQDSELNTLHTLATDNIDSNQAPNWQKPEFNSDTLAFLQYTSGSTGTPKGVMVSHDNLLHNCEYMKQAFSFTPESLPVSWLPSFHDMGLILGILEPLYTGVPVILMSPTAFVQQPIRWLQAISHYKATHSGGPNFAYELCINRITQEELATLDLSTWHFAYNGAEPVRRHTLERFAEKFQPCGFRSNFLYPCYGMAEATLMISGGLGEAEPVYCTVKADELAQNQIVEASSNTQNVRQLVGCGREWLDTKIVIADPESLTQCLPNQVGEIWTSGRSVTQGYWQRPEQTEETFKAQLRDTQEQPFLRTGDLGFLKDGELFITGRLKDVIIIRGRNHYPQDIELTIQQSHPALRPDSGAAFAVEVEGEERLVVVQEVHRNYLRQLNVDEVVGAICEAVSEQHELQVYAVLLLKTASILKTSSGKIQRHGCKNGFLTGNLNVVGEWRQNLHENRPHLLPDKNNAHEQTFSPQATQTKEAIQAWLVAKLSDLLKVTPQEIDVQKSLARYGLDSLAIVNLAGELEQWLGYKLSSTVTYEHPSIIALANYLAKADVTNFDLPTCLIPLQPNGTKPPLFCVHPLGGVVFPYYELARLINSDQPFYALQSVGIEGREQPLNKIEDMAARYIQALRVVQPNGPYFLTGWSFGAYVALEMATQLEQQGQQIAKVILLDTPPLSADRTTNFLNLLRFFLTSSLQHSWPYIYDYFYLYFVGDKTQQSMDFWHLISLINPESIAKVVEHESRLMKFRQPVLQRVLHILQANSEALINYKSKLYQGRITLFSTNSRFGSHEEPTQGWLDLATQGLEIYQIPGHHFNLLRSPHVEVLAQKLTACIEEVQN